MSEGGRPQIVILGAGFAGVGVAQQLERSLGPHEADITVVDQFNFSLYTPMLTEAAGGAVDPPDIIAPIRGLVTDRVLFEQARVDLIDTANRQVTITIGAERLDIPEVQRTIPYDYLVIALGSVTNFRDIPGLREHSLTAKTVQDAVRIRNRALALLERADEEPDQQMRRKLLTFVIGGGGFSGVETAAALNDMVRELAPDCPRVLSHEIRCVVAHPMDRLLPEINKPLAEYTQQELESRGVEVRLNTLVTGAGSDWVELKHAHTHETERIETYSVIWTGGVKPTPVIDQCGLKLGKHGGIVVDGCCRVEGQENTWALGDCAEVPVPGKGGTYAPTAQNAIREGKQVGRNVAAAIHGQEQHPFVYKPIGELAIVGKRAGVASVYGLQFKGIVAWAMWRGIYLAKLPRMAQRFRVLIDWSVDALFGRDIAQIPIATTDVATTMGGEGGKHR